MYIKRQYLYEYESVGRLPNESLRAHINRYRRLEASLRAIGVDVTKTYDEDSRGSRLLGARLTLEQQRLVLVGTNQHLDFDSVKSALMSTGAPSASTSGRESFKHSALPAFQGEGKGHRNSTSASSASSTSASSSSYIRVERATGMRERCGSNRASRCLRSR